MQALHVSSLFARAEQAFVAGRLEAARADIARVEQLAGEHPAVLHLLALVEKKRGSLDAARDAFRRALRLAPMDPHINNNYANLLSKTGDAGTALSHFDRALRAAPGFIDARYNRALLLQRLGRLTEALAELDRVVAASPGEAKAHSARAGVLRGLGRLEDAAAAYDAALQLEPTRLVALHGRARVAMERGEPDASERYAQALETAPDDLALRLGFAEALEAEGKGGAPESLAAAVALHPGWVEGQSVLARMRWEAGEGKDFTRDLECALQAAPKDGELWFAYASALAAADLHAEAAEAAARGSAAAGDEPRLRLLEAIEASEAGEVERADRLFEALPSELVGRSEHAIRHLIRRKEYSRALEQAGRILKKDPWNVSVWAMTGLLWRITSDPRADWLHGQPGLISIRQLELSRAEIEETAALLKRLHRTRAHPIGQSLRGGTQTRGRLFERNEPEIARLRQAVLTGVLGFWEHLPPEDPRHPLLRHRAGRPQFGGSWSVRLTGGGFHVSHVHPAGVLSSACYLVVPEPQAVQEGWLEIGRPPGNVEPSLEPLTRFEPAPGRMALFPSTLFHGTRPFSAGERITAAFDIVVA